MRNETTIINAFTSEETALNSTVDFPYRAALCDLNQLPERLCPWHWHNEVELFYMVKGGLTYYLPGKSCVFSEGDVGFVNVDVLHMTVAVTGSCIQQEHIFLPRLLSGLPSDSIQTKYIEPLIQNPAAELIHIPAEDPVAHDLREWMNRAFAAYTSSGYGYEMRIRSALSEVWLEIAERSGLFAHVISGTDALRIKAMLQYISEHYAEQITLDEIAAAAHIGAREGSRCFKRQMNMPVFNYLLDLRIDRACEFLRLSRMPITEIASRCGFSSASYFTKVFRERMHITPREYRKNRAGE